MENVKHILKKAERTVQWTPRTCLHVYTKTKRCYAMVTGTISVLIEQSLVVMQKPTLKPFHICAFTRGRKRWVIVSARPGLWHLQENYSTWRSTWKSRLSACASAFPPVSGGWGGEGEHRLRDHQTGLQPASDNSCLGPLRLFLQLYNGNDNFSIWTVGYWMIMWIRKSCRNEVIVFSGMGRTFPWAGSASWWTGRV